MLDWQQLPNNHYFRWWDKEREEELQSDIYEFEQDLKDLNLSQELRREKEKTLKELERELVEEERGREYTRRLIKEGAKKARDYNREHGLMTGAEAKQIDSFYYVHSQTWYPLLEAAGIVPDLSLEEIAERSLTANNAAEAYGIELSEYIETTENLQASLDKLPSATSDPLATDLSQFLPEIYKVEWPYELGVYWNERGEKKFSDRETVHSRWGKMQSLIYTHYYQGVSSLPIDLLRCLDKLGQKIKRPRDWTASNARNSVRNPNFPLTDYQQGLLLGSIREGKTTEAKKENSLTFTFNPDKNNQEIRRKAYQRFKRIGDLDLEEKVNKQKGNEQFRRWAEEKEFILKEEYRITRVSLPSTLTGIYQGAGIERVGDMTDDDLIDFLDSEEKKRGFIDQAIWDRGSAGSGSIRYRPKNERVVCQFLEDLELGYSAYERETGNSIYILKSQVDIDPAFSEFRTAYEQATSCN